MNPPRLETRGICKRFGSTQALQELFFSVQPGEVHALIGENGAGKSTLMKILSGAYQPDSGSLWIDGDPYHPRDPLHARRRGIAMIYQELNLAPDLTVAENILLGNIPHRRGWILGRERDRLAIKALEALGCEDMRPDVLVRELPIAAQQRVEIARALVDEPRVLIMDEPTSSLTLADTEHLFRVIERLAERDVSVIYISHFLEECQEICGRYTVLRDGESVDSGEMADVTLDHLVHQMVGRELKEIYQRDQHPLGAPVLELRNIEGRERPQDVSFTLRKGEVFGLAGLIGSGRTETLRALFGLDELPSGSFVLLGNEHTHSSPSRSLAAGMGLLSENRKEEGLLLNRSLADNLTLTRFAPVSVGGIIREREQLAVTKKWMDRLEVKADGPSQRIDELSGGNQQKVALGRLLYHDAEVLLLDEPTRGVDVGSKAQIYRLMNDLAKQGKAIVFVSSYLPELLGVCDTIGVMNRGRLVDVKPADEWTEQAIMLKATAGLEDTSPKETTLA